MAYLSDGDVPSFRVSFSPILSRTGYQQKANFLEPVVKTCQKGKFVRSGCYLVKYSCSSDGLVPRIGYHFRQKFWSRVKMFFFDSTPLYKCRSSTPPPMISRMDVVAFLLIYFCTYFTENIF